MHALQEDKLDRSSYFVQLCYRLDEGSIMRPKCKNPIEGNSSRKGRRRAGFDINNSIRDRPNHRDPRQRLITEMLKPRRRLEFATPNEAQASPRGHDDKEINRKCIKKSVSTNSFADDEEMIPLSIEDYVLTKNRLLFRICWYRIGHEADLFESYESIRFVLDHRSMLSLFIDTMEIQGRKRRLRNLFKKVSYLSPLLDDPYASIDA